MTSPGTPATGSPGSPDGVSGIDPAGGRVIQYSRFGCENCREQHLKCDRVTPKCGTCQRSNRACRPTGLKIRLNQDNGNKLAFPPKQKWVKTPKRLVFIDETKTVMRDASSPGSGVEEFDDSASSEGTIQGTIQPTVPTPIQTRIHQHNVSTSSQSWEFESGPRSPSERFLAKSTPNRMVPPEPLKFPLEMDVEAHLFRHFVNKLALWLDLCDPCRSFEIVVPERARSCPVLLNAILTFSATHISQTCDPRYSAAALEYSIRCITAMREKMRKQDGNQEDGFAAAIILRVVEEMEEKTKKTEQKHLVGIRAFVQEFLVNGNQFLEYGSLGAASFWVGLRQEIYCAVTDRVPVGISLVHSLVNQTLTKNVEASHIDYNWANRAVVHCAKVLNFVFGPPKGQLVERWQELHDEGCAWLKEKSHSFTPFVVDRSPFIKFPQIWFLRSCHVIGMQHALLAQCFLELHHPTRQIDVKIVTRVQSLVREICGIGLGNRNTAPSMFTACMAISAFGEYFTCREEQEEMLEILRETESKHARPTEQIQNDMRKKWNWP